MDLHSFSEVIADRELVFLSPHFDDVPLIWYGLLAQVRPARPAIRIVNVFSRSIYQARDEVGNREVTTKRLQFATGVRLIEDLDCLDELLGRGGYRYGHGTLFDHMALDGLEDAYEKTPNGGGKSMGQFAEDCAGKYTFTREEQDRYAITSTERAKTANTDGSFAWEIAGITVAGRKGDVVIDKDESPFKANPEKIPTLKPAFRKDGTVTAATSSSISDGAAARSSAHPDTPNTT